MFLSVLETPGCCTGLTQNPKKGRGRWRDTDIYFPTLINRAPQQPINIDISGRHTPAKHTPYPTYHRFLHLLFLKKPDFPV